MQTEWTTTNQVTVATTATAFKFSWNPRQRRHRTPSKIPFRRPRKEEKKNVFVKWKMNRWFNLPERISFLPVFLPLSRAFFLCPFSSVDLSNKFYLLFCVCVCECDVTNFWLYPHKTRQFERTIVDNLPLPRTEITDKLYAQREERKNEKWRDSLCVTLLYRFSQIRREHRALVHLN